MSQYQQKLMVGFWSWWNLGILAPVILFPITYFARDKKMTGFISKGDEIIFPMRWNETHRVYPIPKTLILIMAILSPSLKNKEKESNDVMLMID